jgi:hypothetical protein
MLGYRQSSGGLSPGYDVGPELSVYRAPEPKLTTLVAAFRAGREIGKFAAYDDRANGWGPFRSQSASSGGAAPASTASR